MENNKMRLPLPVFEKMVANLQPSELSQLPPDKLPLYIPDDLVKKAPARSVSALEGLLFEAEAHRMRQRMDAGETYGKQVSTALDLVAGGGSPTLNGLFKKKLSEFKQFISEPGVDQNKVTKLLGHLEQSSDDIFHDAALMVTAIKDLAQVENDGSQIANYIKECHGILIELLKDLHRKMDEFALIKLKVKGPSLTSLGERAKNASKELMQLKQGIPETEKHIKSIIVSQKVKSSQVASHPELQSLQNQLATLKARKETLEVIISKEDLTSNLDVLLGGMLIEHDESGKIAKYCYQLWGGMKELLEDYVKSTLAFSELNQLGEQKVKFMRAYFERKSVFWNKVGGPCMPQKIKMLKLIESKLMGEVGA